MSRGHPLPEGTEQAKPGQDSSPISHPHRVTALATHTVFLGFPRPTFQFGGLSLAWISQVLRVLQEQGTTYLFTLTRDAQRPTHSTSMQHVSLYGGTVLSLGTHR